MGIYRCHRHQHRHVQPNSQNIVMTRHRASVIWKTSWGSPKSQKGIFSWHVFYFLVYCDFYVIGSASRATWPIMNSLAWQRHCSEIAFLMCLYEKNSWSRAGMAWHSFFIMSGDFYRSHDTGKVYRAMGGHTFAQPFWPCKSLGNNMWCEDSAADPVWMTMLEWTDFDVLPAQTIAPLGAFVRGLGFSSQVVHLLGRNPVSPLRHAALCGFRGCNREDLQKLAQECQLASRGFFL